MFSSVCEYKIYQSFMLLLSEKSLFAASVLYGTDNVLSSNVYLLKVRRSFSPCNSLKAIKQVLSISD